MKAQVLAGHHEAGGISGRSGWPIAAGVALALAVLAATILVSLLHLRRHVFTQIANRDGETLDAVAAMQYADDRANDGSITNLADPGEQIQLAFEISKRFRNVLGVRLFSADGKFIIAAPAYITEATLSQSDVATLRQARPVSHFIPRGHLEQYDLLADAGGAAVPLLEVSIPLREEGSTRLEGIAQFLMNGSSIAREYAELDRHMVAQGTLAFAISGTIVSTGFLLSFRRVQRANALLAERTSNLLKANRELALAAKTSAIGAVTSHLIHGLKNPLSGLRSFVQDRALGEQSRPDSDWQLAIATTQRMQSLIDRVVRVLQEQQIVAEYEISFSELIEMIAAKLQPVAQTAGVSYTSGLSASGTVSNRDADLILLILENLLQNAIEATPAGKAVHLRVHAGQGSVLMDVEDQGPGLRPALADRLFTPCASAKKGGSGIGLAISRQLAIHLGASLELKHSTQDGCCFRLVLPAPGPSIKPSEAGTSQIGFKGHPQQDSVLASLGPKQAS
jgi:signal transduction histidine kinase